MRRETTVIFDLGRGPNVVGGGRALGEERKGIFAVLPAQKCASLEGAEPAPLEGNLFSFDCLQMNKTSSMQSTVEFFGRRTSYWEQG